MGFSISLNLFSPECDLVDQFHSSPDIKQNKAGVNSQEIDTRTVKAFWEIDRGRDAMLTFMAFMNMSPQEQGKLWCCK